MDDELRDTIDTVALTRLHAAYADTCTRRAWDELHDEFLPTARVHLDLGSRGTRTIDGPRELGEFIDTALAPFEFFQFVVLNSWFSLRTDGDPDRATGRMWMSELRQVAAFGQWNVIYGLYRDEYVRTADGWRIAGRRYQTLSRKAPDYELFPIPQD